MSVAHLDLRVPLVAAGHGRAPKGRGGCEGLEEEAEWRRWSERGQTLLIIEKLEVAHYSAA